MKKQAFSIIELIIVITILVLLAIVSMTVFNKRSDESQNTRVVADMNTIKASLVSYRAEESGLILPSGNRNFFSETGTYVHMDKGNPDYTKAYGVYGSFTEDLLPNRYLNTLPLDPRTNQYYAYGVKLSNGQFDLAGVIKDIDSEIYLARTVYNYDGVGGINSLIREYNGPNFVKDMSARLPYNPENRVLVVVDQNGKVYHEGDTVSSGADEYLEIYFSDGSVSVLDPNTTMKFEELNFPKENLLASNVRAMLSAGAIWTKVTQLDDNSSFVITNGDINAAVRGTIFKMDSNGSVRVVEGEVVIWPIGGDEYEDGVSTIGGGDYTGMPAFATPDYDETALGGYDNVEDFGANKGRVNDNAYGNERKEACSYLWKDLKSSTYGDYTWDSCFGDNNDFFTIEDGDVLSFQLKSMDAGTDQNEDILFTIGDFDFRTSKVPGGNKKFNIKSSTGISFTSGNVNDDDLIEIKFSQGENGKIGIKVYVNNEELWYTSLSDHSLTYVKFDIGSKILFKKENIIDSDYNNSMMPELLKK